MVALQERSDPRRVLNLSPFLQRLAERHPDWLDALTNSGRLQRAQPPNPSELDEEIAAEGLSAGLRRFRNREMLRIVWRELARSASLEQTFTDLGRLAEICLERTIAQHDAELRERFGTPRDAAGAPQSLVVLGLGKLGGGELNLSSDIDLIFCFPSAGQCDGRRGLANEQYFTRLARAVVGSLSEITEHGFCFRVDTRLRPFGEAGPLTCSFGALEQYYQREGRDWERYALVKARPVAGDRRAGAELLDTLRPFVYRRYIDYGAVEALREMLASIRADAARIDRGDDIKRGPGGIREIEFLVQCLQLLRGGREPALRTPSLLAALAQLATLGLLPAERVAALRDHYEFLRRLENAVQALHDQQTHCLPEGADRARVASAMEYETSPMPRGEGAGASAGAGARVGNLNDRLAEVRRGVREALEQCFPAPPADEDAGDDWRRRLAGGAAEDQAAEDGQVREFLQRLERAALSQRARQRLDRLMPILVGRLETRQQDPSVRRDVLTLLLAIARRSAYLALLYENPLALDRMLDLFSASDWVAQTVIRYPALLDELIAPSLGRNLPDREDLVAGLARVAGPDVDPESALLELNHAKRAQSLRIAVAELADGERGQANAGTDQSAAERLTVLAEVLLGGCLDLAARILVERHGRLEDLAMAVIGYGTLGGRDMSYGSDVDLVFLYAENDGMGDGASATMSDGPRPLSAEQYHTRLVRRFLSLTTTTTAAGRLYDVDTRLRPNGRAGLLVSSLDAFRRYQAEAAWTWELQALVRARPVAGDPGLGQAFLEARAEVLARPRDPSTLREEVADMRRRLRRHAEGQDDLKQGPGGLVDLDFLAQLGVLECACEHPGLLRIAASGAQLRELGRIGWLPEREATQLADLHANLTRCRHLRALSRGPLADAPDRELGARVFARYLGAAEQ